MSARRREPVQTPQASDRLLEMAAEVDALRAQSVEDRFEIDQLRSERAMLSGRIDRLERYLHSLRASILDQLAPPRVLAEYSPGILHAVCQPPAAGVPDQSHGPVASEIERVRFSVDKLPTLAVRMLDQVAALPARRAEISQVAAALGLSPSGGHFKRGLAMLRKYGLIAQEQNELRVVGTYRKSA